MRDKPEPKPSISIGSPTTTAMNRMREKKAPSDLKIFGITQTIHPYYEMSRPKTQINNMRENVVVSCQPVEHLLRGNSSQLLRNSEQSPLLTSRQSIDMRKIKIHGDRPDIVSIDEAMTEMMLQIVDFKDLSLEDNVPYESLIQPRMPEKTTSHLQPHGSTDHRQHSNTHQDSAGKNNDLFSVL